jgi:hypothetical protein
VHETAWKNDPAGADPSGSLGVTTCSTAHDRPFHPNARGKKSDRFVVAPSLSPTAMHGLASVGQETALRLPDVGGMGIAFQPVPFHCSASGMMSSETKRAPTATHRSAAEHDTPDRLDAPARAGMAISFQDEPFQRSASVSLPSVVSSGGGPEKPPPLSPTASR